MARDWKFILKEDPIDWLLETENPSVRFYTLTDILDYPPNDPEVLEAKSAINNSKKVTKIFCKQKPRG